MNAITDIRPISEVKQKFFEIAEQVQRTGRPVYVTKNGRAMLTVVDAEYLQFLQNEKEKSDLDAILRGLDDVEAGRTMSIEECFNKINEKFGWK